MSTPLQQALQLSTSALRNFANSADFWTKFGTAFGSSYNLDRATAIRQSMIEGKFSFPVKVLSPSIMGAVTSAFLAPSDFHSIDSANTIYLRSDLVQSGNVLAMNNALLEELGRAINAIVNTTDEAGDEGAIFKILVSDGRINANVLSALKAESFASAVGRAEEEVIETLVISGSDVKITGTTASDNIVADAGNDRINAGFGDDNVNGNDGNDQINGGFGRDRVFGGSGNDRR
jgi:hypothetical protein